jgi:hypothetical protein
MYSPKYRGNSRHFGSGRLWKTIICRTTRHIHRHATAQWTVQLQIMYFYILDHPAPSFVGLEQDADPYTPDATVVGAHVADAANYIASKCDTTDTADEVAMVNGYVFA